MQINRSLQPYAYFGRVVVRIKIESPALGEYQSSTRYYYSGRVFQNGQYGSDMVRCSACCLRDAIDDCVKELRSIARSIQFEYPAVVSHCDMVDFAEGKLIPKNP